MIGQEKLIETITNFTPASFPHSVMIVGEKGSGQGEICNKIAAKFGMFITDISESITLDFIDNMVMACNPAIYRIDTDKISVREQNMLLKVYEEPSPFTYIILCCEDESKILDTLKNRSYIFKMEKYTKEQLEPLIIRDKDLVLGICNTPGQIEVANHTNMPALKKLCETIVSSMGKASFQNTLTISNKINFKDEYDKFDLYLFMRMLGDEFLIKGKKAEYNILNEANKKIWNVLNKKQQFEHFLILLWKEARVEH